MKKEERQRKKERPSRHEHLGTDDGDFDADIGAVGVTPLKTTDTGYSDYGVLRGRHRSRRRCLCIYIYTVV